MGQQRTASDYGTPCNDARTCSRQAPDSWDQEELLNEFDDLLAIQCSPGNWDHDPYLHGMANGVLLMRSIVSGEEPDFLDAPNEWGSEKVAYHQGFVAARYVAAYTMQPSQEELWGEYEDIVADMEGLAKRYQRGGLSAKRYDIEMEQLEQMLREIEDDLLPDQH